MASPPSAQLGSMLVVSLALLMWNSTKFLMSEWVLTDIEDEFEHGIAKAGLVVGIYAEIENSVISACQGIGKIVYLLLDVLILIGETPAEGSLRPRVSPAPGLICARGFS